MFLQLYKGWKIGDDGKIVDGHISFKDYLTCWKFWNKFGMKNMSDYHDLCHYFCSPGLSGDAMIKMTGVKLEKISDSDKYLFIEKWSRGGFSSIAKR